MLCLRKPTPAEIETFLAVQARLELTYQAPVTRRSAAPPGFVVDHTRTRLGQGEAVFAAAKAALEQWRQFQLGWLEAWPTDRPIMEGEVVAVVAWALGLWWLNACRITHVIREHAPHPRFGFTYATLPAHVGSGEERFLLEMDESQHVWYDVRAFSRPHSLLARMGYPYLRRVQKRFGRQSAAAMRKAVSSVSSEAEAE